MYTIAVQVIKDDIAQAEGGDNPCINGVIALARVERDRNRAIIGIGIAIQAIVATLILWAEDRASRQGERDCVITRNKVVKGVAACAIGGCSLVHTGCVSQRHQYTFHAWLIGVLYTIAV